MLQNAANHPFLAPSSGEESKGSQDSSTKNKIEVDEIDVTDLCSHKQDLAKKKFRAEEMALLIEQGKDQVSEEDAAALRLPNAVKTQSARLNIATEPDNNST